MIFIGDVGIDIYQTREGPLQFWGGCSLNAWLAAREIDPEARLLSLYSTSTSFSYPTLLLDQIESWPKTSLPPPRQKIHVDSHGERHLGDYESGFLTEFSGSIELRELIKFDAIIALPLYEQTKDLCLFLLEGLPASASLCLDVGTMVDFLGDLSFLSPYLDKILLIQSSEEFPKLSFATTTLIKTNGSGAIEFLSGEGRGKVLPEVYRGRVVDTTGAGDYFFGRLCSLIERQGIANISELIYEASKGVGRILARKSPNLLE